MRRQYLFFLMLLVFLIPTKGFSQDIVPSNVIIEEIYGMRIGPKGVLFQVFSGGCTSKSDFLLQRFESNPDQLILLRIRPDYCDAFIPYGIDIQYSYEEIGIKGGDSFIVINPLASVTVYREE